jgi:hypothetical protein
MPRGVIAVGLARARQDSRPSPVPRRRGAAQRTNTIGGCMKRFFSDASNEEAQHESIIRHWPSLAGQSFRPEPLQ